MSDAETIDAATRAFLDDFARYCVGLYLGGFAPSESDGPSSDLILSDKRFEAA